MLQFSTAGKYGLIIISHGSGGSNLNHRNLALFLSKRGYIVAAILHPNNNYNSNSSARTQGNWEHRPQHIKKAADFVLNSEFGLFIDKKRISVIGHSIGGFAAVAVAVAGGKYNLAKINEHCQVSASLDRNFCGFSAFWPALYKVLRPLMNFKDDVRYEENHLFSKIILFAPVAVPFHGDTMLENIDIPLILSSELDKELSNQYHGVYLARNIKQAKHEVIKGQGISPLSQNFHQNYTTKWVKRAMIHLVLIGFYFNNL